MKKLLLLIAFVLISVFVSSCSHFSNNSVNSIQVVADPEANYNTVTDVDVVFVYDDSLLIPETNGDWFDVHNDLRFDRKLKVVHLRITPALINEVQLPEQHFLASKVLAFVNFKKNEDQPPMDLTKNKNPVILIKDDNYQLSWRRQSSR